MRNPKQKLKLKIVIKKRAISVLDKARKGLISIKPDLRLPIVL